MAQYNAKQQFTIPRQIVLKNGVNVETLANDKTLDKASSMIQILNADGSDRTINLPPVKDGMIFFIVNQSGTPHDLNVTKPDTSVISVEDGKTLLIACDGVDWHQVLLVPFP